MASSGRNRHCGTRAVRRWTGTACERVRARLARQEGFTIVELIVVILLTAIVLVAVLASFTSMTNVFHRETVRIQNQDSARVAINQIAELLRSATSSEDNASTKSNAIATALPQDIEFYCDVDGDGISEKVRYYLDGSTLMAQTSEPEWVVDDDDPDISYWEYPEYQTDGIVVQDAIRNDEDPVFTYWHYNGTVLEEFDPLTDDTRRVVVAVSISLEVNERPDLSNTNVLLATDVQIRQRYDGGL